MQTLSVSPVYEPGPAQTKAYYLKGRPFQCVCCVQ